ncbi:MAG TPA: hypothetical protein VL096_01785, partial [Pirellulaceae bacterium]|nr:hypothetical protein [Pirellulaceae bacterium]
AELARVQAKVKSILYELSIVQREMHTHLLESSSVQKELKLSTDQEQRMPKLLADWSQNRSALFEQFHSLSEENRHTKLVAMAEQHEQMLESMLTPAQLQRFRQIALQSQGLFAFKEPETIAALDLTPEQRAKIRDIEREMFGGRFRGPPGGGPPGGPRNAGDNRMNKGPGRRGPGGPGGHESFSRESKAAVAKVLELLSPEQREAWATLSGGPFAGFIDDEFSLPFPQPPR